jgi:hypothetical protein
VKLSGFYECVNHLSIDIRCDGGFFERNHLDSFIAAGAENPSQARALAYEPYAMIIPGGDLRPPV